MADFDFDAFMQKALANTELSKEVRDEVLRDELDNVMTEVGPRLWQVLVREMMKKPGDAVHLNAIINAALYSAFAFAAACIPPGETEGVDNDDALVTACTNNLRVCLEHGRSNGPSIVAAARSVGEMQLLRDANESLHKQVLANNIVLQHVATILNKGN